MWLLTYEGGREDTNFRHPEQLAVMAPKHLQEACVRHGGLNLYGNPNFRLVLVSSRYQIAGGHEFTFLDRHGDYLKTCPAEMLIPRYAAQPAERDLYLLEKWRSPEWYYNEGFGVDDVEFNAVGEAVRCMEPVWPEGGYEAVWYEAAQMAVFPKNISGDHQALAWMIRMSLRAEEFNEKIVLNQVKADRERERRQDIEENTQRFMEKGSPRLFIEPAVSYSGLDATKEEMWKQSESSVLAQ